MFFFTPLVLLAAGVRASEIENRRLASSPNLKHGWKAFDQATKFLVDRLPLREQAIRVNTWKSIHLFRTTPRYQGAAAGAKSGLPFGTTAGADNTPSTASQVVDGRAGWLFLQGDVDRACAPFLSWDEAVGRWERVAQMIRASGRSVVVLIAPDKSTIYPEYLPVNTPTSACTRDGKRALWKRIQGSSVRAIPDLRTAVETAKRGSDQLLYFKKDSHWNSVGSLILVHRAVESVGPASIPDSHLVDGGTAKHVGDLGTLLGAPEEEEYRVVSLARPGLRMVGAADEKLPRGGVLHTVRYAKANTLLQLPGRTLFVYDSFGVGPVDGLQQQAREFSTAQWYNTDPVDIATAIGQSDTVILETAEREVTYRANEILTPAFFRALERELARERRSESRDHA